MCAAGGLALWHPGGVFLLNCFSSTAVIANKKLKSTLTPAPTPAPTPHKCSLSTLLSEKHPAEDAVEMWSPGLTASSPLMGRQEATAGKGGGSGPQLLHSTLLRALVFGTETDSLIYPALESPKLLWGLSDLRPRCGVWE